MKKYIIDLDEKKMIRAKLNYNKKHNHYYIAYFVRIFTVKKFVIPPEWLDRDIFVIKNDKIYAVDNTDLQKATTYTREHINTLLSSKIIANLLQPTFTTQLLYILLGVGVGIGVGFMLHSYYPPPTQIPFFGNATTNTTTITTITLPFPPR